MSNLERLELQLLEAIIPAGSEGRSFTLTQLFEELAIANKSLLETPRPSTYDEIIAALIDLRQRECISIRHYDGGEPRRREGGETPVLFYRGSFHCVRQLPESYQLRAMLQGADKNGVFISHNVPEGELASALKNFLRAGRGETYPVFVSSDYRSIQSGKQWFPAIVEAVHKAEAVLVVVTPDSFPQPWVNFEAGIGVGCGIPVVPMLTRGFGKSDLKAPLSQLQARDLANKKDFDGMVADFKEMFRCNWTREAADSLFAKILTICAELDSAVEAKKETHQEE